MLFVAFLTATGGTAQERIGRRMEWQYPEGMQVVAEYWLQSADINVVSVFEADSVAPIMATLNQWDDMFDITVIPAVTSEEGLQLAKQMMRE